MVSLRTGYLRSETALTVHASQELRNNPTLHLTLSALSLGRDSVYFVYEEKAWGSALR